MTVKIPKKEILEFMAVGLGKDGRPFHHFKDTDKIKLVPEPDNKYDKNAIKIYANDIFVAYVSKENNVQIKLMLKRDHKIKYYLIDKYSRSARFLAIDLNLSLKLINL